VNDYQRKLEKAAFELYEKGIRRKQSHPLYFKLLRALGIEVRLPHYSEPKHVFIGTSLYIGVLVVALLLFLQRNSVGMGLPTIVSIAVILGVVFGGIMMSLNAHNRKKYELTDWDDLLVEQETIHTESDQAL